MTDSSPDPRVHSPSGQSSPRLSIALCDWLERERAALCRSWEAQGLAPTESAERVLCSRTYRRTGESQAEFDLQFRTERVEVSRLAAGRLLPVLWRPEATPPKELLVDAYGEDCIPESGRQRLASGFSNDIDVWLAQLAGDYLSSLANVTSPDPDAAVRLVDSYLAYLEGDTIREVTQVAIGGLIAPEAPITLPDGGVSVRALSAEELGEMHKECFGARTMLDPGVLPKQMGVLGKWQTGFESCMLTVGQTQPKYGAYALSWRAHRTILALQLMGYPICGRGAIAAWTQPGPRVYRFYDVPRLPWSPDGPEAPITLQELGRAADIASRLPAGCFDKPGSRDEIALHRFSLAASQDDASEAIIDYVITLEGLLLPGIQAELLYRFSLNGARYLSREPEERAVFHGELKALYLLRSRLVHGAGAKGVDLGKNRKRARELAQQGLVKALLNGWPDHDYFVALALE